ncbi:CoA ester lyase [Bosea sp. (in: a-proteobacteria)]|uniref:HpcH/HpaI aldolase/citrate lyase family protein n=1 Tax=Bosea sp. (in: a-proteobacteria) TaxID=1871050 RepID=UPI002629AF8C|nr:CoA ester lyase [Bosea sp. (in: a-proteobacteria)]MCO5090209.1 CoA ester lyase [Bosea sp. (in: a-proteobacteria)]
MTCQTWPIRSFLFVPAHRPAWVAKALRCAPEAIILDLEDSVPPAEKQSARKLLAAEVAEAHAGGVKVFVRINQLSSETADELEAAVRDGLTGLIVPKVDGPSEVRRVHDLLSHAEGRAGLRHESVSLLLLPETARGVLLAFEVASASSRVRGLIGSVSGLVAGDVAAAVGYRPSASGEEQIYVNSRLVLASRAAGALYPIAGTMGVPVGDAAAMETLIRRARHLGFSGVALIHPSHVEIAHRVLRPTTEEVAHAAGLLEALEAAENRGEGAVIYKGYMIDQAMVAAAREILRDAGKTAGRLRN